MLNKILRNRYKIIKKLGEGGFGHTYLAKDEDLHSSLCVVKHLQPDNKDNLDVARRLFEQEGKILHGLKHDQIPTLSPSSSQNVPNTPLTENETAVAVNPPKRAFPRFLVPLAIGLPLFGLSLGGIFAYLFPSASEKTVVTEQKEPPPPPPKPTPANELLAHR